MLHYVFVFVISSTSSRWPFLESGWFCQIEDKFNVNASYVFEPRHENIAETEQSSRTPAVAIRGMLKQFCRSKFLIFANWRDRKKKKSKGTSIFWLLVFGVHNRSTICPCVYQAPTLVSQKKKRQNFNVLEFERKLEK